MLPAGLACDSPLLYCPANSSRALATPGTHYAIPTEEGLFFNSTVCEPGWYCTEGRRRMCPAGRYGDAPGGVNASCVGPCADGYFCALGSSSPTAAPCSLAGPAFVCPTVRVRPTVLLLCIVCSQLVAHCLGGSALLPTSWVALCATDRRVRRLSWFVMKAL